jgi:trehalose synthase
VLRAVAVGSQPLNRYRRSSGDRVIDELQAKAADLRHLRVLHLNATPYGGGVAELLRSEVPLLRDLGIDADWKIITGDEEFFRITKAIHNGLQGAEEGVSASSWNTYDRESRSTAEDLTDGYDIVVVHDPQPLPLPHLRGRGDSLWVWRCHVDTSQPNQSVWDRLERYFDDYDAAVFTSQAFVPTKFPSHLVEVVPPAIDPESPKNIELNQHLARRVLGWLGVDLERPLVVQVSRFDRWKDPMGVIDVYRRAKSRVADLQLALVGSMALDDPEAWAIYAQIQSLAVDDPDLYVFTNLNGVSNIEVNAFQRLADVVVQKSIREGFGLVVSESLWKATPVVAGKAGGIPLQLRDGVGGYLIDSVDECTDRVVELLEDPKESARIGDLGRQHVHDHFLLPRLIGDDVDLYRRLVLGS